VLSLVGPKTPVPTTSRKNIPRIGENAIELEDRTVIQLSNIKEIADGMHVIGAPQHPLIRAINAELEQGYGVVYLLDITWAGV